MKTLLLVALLLTTALVGPAAADCTIDGFQNINGYSDFTAQGWVKTVDEGGWQVWYAPQYQGYVSYHPYCGLMRWLGMPKPGFIFRAPFFAGLEWLHSLPIEEWSGTTGLYVWRDAWSHWPIQSWTYDYLDGSFSTNLPPQPGWRQRLPVHALEVGAIMTPIRDGVVHVMRADQSEYLYDQNYNIEVELVAARPLISGGVMPQYPARTAALLVGEATTNLRDIDQARAQVMADLAANRPIVYPAALMAAAYSTIRDARAAIHAMLLGGAEVQEYYDAVVALQTQAMNMVLDVMRAEMSGQPVIRPYVIPLPPAVPAIPAPTPPPPQPDPNAPTSTPPPMLPVPVPPTPPPPPVPSQPAPAPALTPDQEYTLRVVANYYQYGHSRGWSDAQICWAVCAIFNGPILSPVMRDPSYVGTISTTLRGYYPDIVSDYTGMINMLNAVNGIFPNQNGYNRILELH
jgi:hypothetical protein